MRRMVSLDEQRPGVPGHHDELCSQWTGRNADHFMHMFTVDTGSRG